MIWEESSLIMGLLFLVHVEMFKEGLGRKALAAAGAYLLSILACSIANVWHTDSILRVIRTFMTVADVAVYGGIILVDDFKPYFFETINLMSC